MCLDPKGKDASLLAKKLNEHIAESQSRKEKDGRKRSKILGKEQEADAVAKEAEQEQEQEQEQVEVHSKKSESSPAKNEKGKKKVGRPAKNEKGKSTVRILLIYIIFLKPFLLSMLHYCHNMHTSNESVFHTIAFQCDICKRRLKKGEVMSAHLESHKFEKPLECTYPGCKEVSL